MKNKIAYLATIILCTALGVIGTIYVYKKLPQETTVKNINRLTRRKYINILAINIFTRYNSVNLKMRKKNNERFNREKNNTVQIH